MWAFPFSGWAWCSLACTTWGKPFDRCEMIPIPFLDGGARAPAAGSGCRRHSDRGAAILVRHDCRIVITLASQGLIDSAGRYRAHARRRDRNLRRHPGGVHRPQPGRAARGHLPPRLQHLHRDHRARAHRLVDLGEQTAAGGDSLPRQIANAHVAFNVLGVALFIGFVPQIARLLRRVIPGEDRLTWTWRAPRHANTPQPLCSNSMRTRTPGSADEPGGGFQQRGYPRDLASRRLIGMCGNALPVVYLTENRCPQDSMRPLSHLGAFDREVV